MNTKTYNKCEFIIRQFMAIEKPTPELLGHFYDWLFNGRDCHEKNVIIRKVFFETLSGVNPNTSAPER